MSLQWIVNAYTIAFAAFILTTGALSDRIGAKRVFVAGFAIFTLASLACALAPTLPVLIAARGVQGLGAAVLVPSSLALLNHAYPGEQERGKAVSIWAAGASLALTAGPLVGGGRPAGEHGSVLGVALFGSLAGSAGGVLPGLRLALIIAATLLASSAAAVLIGIPGRKFSGP